MSNQFSAISRPWILLLACLALLVGCEDKAAQEAQAGQSGESAAPAPESAHAPGAEDETPAAEDEAPAADEGEAAAATEGDEAAEPTPGEPAEGATAGDETAQADTPTAAPSDEGAYAPTGVLGQAARDIFYGSPTDPPTEELLGITEEFVGRHYVVGDEYNVHLFYPHVKDLGGGYMGVGADQAYLFIGWQKPELAWLVDYDEWVVAMHQAYREFFLAADSPDAFMKFWSDSGEEAALALLDEKLADHPMHEITVTMYKRYRNSTRARINRLIKTFEANDVPSVYHDQATYSFVRNLIAEGRVRPMLTNLLDDTGVKGIGQAQKELGVPIRLLYVSNAEEYWDYPQNFRDNINALTTDDNGVVLRTLSTWKINKDYQYAVQSLADYQGWLQRDWVVRVSYIVQRVREFAEDDELKTPMIVIDNPIADAEARRAERKARKKNKKK